MKTLLDTLLDNNDRISDVEEMMEERQKNSSLLQKYDYLVD